MKVLRRKRRKRKRKLLWQNEERRKSFPLLLCLPSYSSLSTPLIFYRGDQYTLIHIFHTFVPNHLHVKVLILNCYRFFLFFRSPLYVFSCILQSFSSPRQNSPKEEEKKKKMPPQLDAKLECQKDAFSKEKNLLVP